MALKKVKQLENGTSGDYWKITQCVVDKNKMTLNVAVELFASKAVADAGGKSLKVRYGFSKECSKEELAGDLVALGYEIIKEQANAEASRQFDFNKIAKDSLKGAIDA